MSPRTRLRLPAPRRVRGWIAGDHPSVHQGRSSDYDDIRQYEPGDDVRDVDWKATARSGSIVLRRHVAENLQRLLLVVDTGVAMSARAAGGDVKAELARHAAHVLGAAATNTGDLVGLVAGDASSISVEPMRRGGRQLDRIVARLRSASAAEGAAPAVVALLDRARRSTGRRQLVAVVTDEAALDDDHVADALRRLRLRHDVLWVTIRDAEALVDTRLDAVDLVDVVGGATLPAALRDDPELLADYVAAVADARRRRQHTLRRLVVPEVEIGHADEVLGAIARLLERARRA